MPEKRSGWILAGGRSSRMGADKALLEIERQPLALQIAAELAKVCGPVSLIGDPDRYAPLGLPVFPDSFPGLGPLAGIEAALSASRSDANLIVACDMPRLTAEAFEKLLSAGGVCAVPRYPDGQVEPLCAVYGKRCHGAIRVMLETGVRSVKEALRLLEAQFEVRYLAVEPDGTFASLNTPEDLARHRGTHRHA